MTKPTGGDVRLSGVVRGARGRGTERFAVRLAENDYLVFEQLAGNPVYLGDAITEIRDTTEHQTVFNATQGRSIRIRPLLLHAPHEMAARELRGRPTPG